MVAIYFFSFFLPVMFLKKGENGTKIENAASFSFFYSSCWIDRPLQMDRGEGKFRPPFCWEGGHFSSLQRKRKGKLSNIDPLLSKNSPLPSFA